jgi:endogenous inhibitor of DNA gyrase (YacG/DUF329 family)
MTLNRYQGQPCPLCGDFSPKGTSHFPYCGAPCQVFDTGGLVALLEYARDRVELAPDSSVALGDTKAALSLAVKKIQEAASA